MSKKDEFVNLAAKAGLTIENLRGVDRARDEVSPFNASA